MSTVSVWRCTFQQQQCQSHYALGPEVAGVTGKPWEYMAWGQKTRIEKHGSESVALFNSKPGGIQKWLTYWVRESCLGTRLAFIKSKQGIPTHLFDTLHYIWGPVTWVCHGLRLRAYHTSPWSVAVPPRCQSVAICFNCTDPLVLNS